jgi:hypothetical protein
MVWDNDKRDITRKRWSLFYLNVVKQTHKKIGQRLEKKMEQFVQFLGSPNIGRNGSGMKKQAFSTEVFFEFALGVNQGAIYKGVGYLA